MDEESSTDFRTTGNRLFAVATTKLSPENQETCLRKAATAFTTAIQKAGKDPALHARAHKNLGKTYLKLVRECLPRTDAAQSVLSHDCTRAFDSLRMAALHAVEAGRDQFPREWHDDIANAMINTIHAAVEHLKTKLDRARWLAGCEHLHLTSTIRRASPTYSGVVLLACDQRANLLFKIGVEHAESGEHLKCLIALHEAHSPLDTARALAEGEHFEQLEELRDSLMLHHNISKAAKLIGEGDGLFKSLGEDYEELDMDLTWDVVDRFRQAISVVNEQDVEQECIALSRLAKVFRVVLKDDARAKSMYKQAFVLACSKGEEVFANEKWFQDVSAMHHQYEPALVEEPDNPMLEKVKPLVKLVREKAAESTQALIEYVQKKHPPRPGKSGKKPDEVKVEGSSLRSALRKLMMYYHPDKQQGQDDEWKALSSEIYKVLAAENDMLK